MRLQTQRQAVAGRIDLRDHRFGGFQRAAAPADDLQHRAEDFVIDLVYRADFKGSGRNAAWYFFYS